MLTLAIPPILWLLDLGRVSTLSLPTPQKPTPVHTAQPVTAQATSALMKAGAAWGHSGQYCVPPKAMLATRTDDMVVDTLLVAPQYKFAFCFIGKVACTSFNQLLNSMNNITEVSSYCRSSATQMGYDPAKITRENGWFKGIFLREPTERFLSAYLSKCERSKDGYLEQEGTNCLGNVIEEGAPLEGRHSNFLDSIDQLENYDGNNPHYLPQRRFCGGLSPTLVEYDYVGHVTDYADVHNQVHEMLARAGIAFDATVEKYFPSVAEDSDHVKQAASQLTDYFSDVSDIQKVRDFYAEDYVLPGLR